MQHSSDSFGAFTLFKAHTSFLFQTMLNYNEFRIASIEISDYTHNQINTNINEQEISQRCTMLLKNLRNSYESDTRCLEIYETPMTCSITMYKRPTKALPNPKMYEDLLQRTIVDRYVRNKLKNN